MVMLPEAVSARAPLLDIPQHRILNEANGIGMHPVHHKCLVLDLHNRAIPTRFIQMISPMEHARWSNQWINIRGLWTELAQLALKCTIKNHSRLSSTMKLVQNRIYMYPTAIIAR